MNDGITVLAKQNEAESLELLAAMRQNYIYQKWGLTLLFTLNVVVVIVLAVLASLLNSQSFNEWVAVYGVFLTFIDVVILTPRMKGFGVKAAAIQELFDCYVLGLPKHIVKQPDCVDSYDSYDSYDISTAAKAYKEVPEAPLNDWYSKVTAEMTTAEAVYNAQLMNVYWDKKQKEIFQKWALIVLGILSCIVLLTAYMQDLGFRSLLAYVMPLILPAVIFWFNFHSGLAGDITRLQKLEALVKSISTNSYDSDKARQIQDAIYEHRRANTPVFEWVFKRLRPAFEKA